MANQGPDRRTMLEMLAKAAVASQFAGFSRWAYAQQHDHSTGTALPRAAHYEPSYFSASEYKTIEVLTELIIPRDDTPGAKEAGVSEFIDFLAAHGEGDLQQPMRDGLHWLGAASEAGYGRSFLELSPQQQTELLTRVAYRDRAQPGDEDGRKFFRLIRRYTVMGYYTSRVGLVELDYPGLKLYSQSPACPHSGDPEHVHLPPSKF